ncbi:MAG: iron-sulfur cluster biosynthesis transcriptional regulator SufR [Synechococcaceae cyanobacterium RL_1_2]|nr:iron-sulfur cluster biosynthesis transcriptional regulator SufR [Synechococcaceae cyanobacterium RL_1_2]
MVPTHHQSTKESILHYLLKQGQATTQELAEYLQVSVQAIRRHLRDLENEQLVDHQKHTQGMGRPNYLYGLSDRGKNYFPHDYEGFSVSLLNTLVETVGEEQAGNVLVKQWHKKAQQYQQRLGTTNLGDKLKKLVQIRQQEGYMAELNSLEPGKYVLVEHHCAIEEVAHSFPAICDHELEMFALIFSECKVERTHWLKDGEQRCGYLIQEI